MVIEPIYYRDVLHFVKNSDVGIGNANNYRKLKLIDVYHQYHFTIKMGEWPFLLISININTQNM